MKRAQAPLPTRLRRASTLLRTWKKACRDGCTVRYGSAKGTVTDARALRELADFDAAIQAVNEAIKIASVPQLEKPGSHGGLTQCDMHEDESL